MASPNGANANYLFATAAVNPNDVWAVGVDNIGLNLYDQPLAEHWNGTAWSVTTVPNPSPGFWADVNGVAAISTNDVWMVGDYRVDLAGDVDTFAEHWNGNSWSLVYPSNPTPFSELFAVTAVSSNDVWAVGRYYSGGYLSFVEHWNGTTWTATTPPQQLNGMGFADNELNSVAAFSSTDVWAVGDWQGTPYRQSLALHWNGSAWSIVATTNEGGDNIIAAVVALEAGHAVGVGLGSTISGNPSQGEAWDLLSAGGSTNTFEGVAGTGENVLEGVDRSGSAVWAVGFQSPNVGAPPRTTLVIPATWNSSTHTLTWGASPGVSANPSATNSVLYAVSAVSPYEFWAAGYQTSNTIANLDQTLTEDYCALHFNMFPTSTPSIGSPFSLTVTVQNGNGAMATGYGGRVHFTSTDGSAVLPGDYTFVPGDAGAHTFSGVVINTPCTQTITAADLAMPFTTPGLATVRAFKGVCQSPAGIAGSRAGNASSSGTAGGRAANASGAGTPGPRRPVGSGSAPGTVGSGPAATANSPAATADVPTGIRDATLLTEVRSAGGSPLTGRPGAADRVAEQPVAARTAVASPRAEPPWNLLLIVPLLVGTLALGGRRRRRLKERTHGLDRP